ncbi:MAG: tetratricopeptide repeat protein [Terracidiphilus sp.]|jgi:tetratricopeptide (TPR) repeat protein
MSALLKLVLSGVFIAFCSAAVLQSETQGAEPVGSPLQQHYDAALRLQKEGDLDQAALQYRAFLTAALGELANSHAQIEAYARASALFDEALALTPDSSSVRQDYATAALQAGDLKRAESLARIILNDNKNDSKSRAVTHQILGRTLLSMNRDQEARSELEAAAALDPSFRNEYDLAVVCLDLDDEKCAMEIFDKIEASVEDSPALHMQFGLAYGNSDFAPRAVTEFKKVIAKDPHYPNAHYCAAAALLVAGEDEKTLKEAESELKQELAISPNSFLTYAALGKIEASYHRYPEAERYLKRAVLLNPKNPDAFLYLGQIYFDTNRLTEAEVNLRRAVELTTDISRNHYQIQKAHFLLGRILMQKHQEEKAHAEMQIAHEFTDKALSRDKTRLAGMLSDSATYTGSSDAGFNFAANSSTIHHAADPVAVSKQRAFEKQLTPAIADSYNNLGTIMATKKNYTNALKYFQQAAAWHPSFEGLDLNMGRAAFMAAKFSEAVPPLSHYLQSHPGDSGIHGALAMSQFMTNNYKGCIDALKGADEKVTSIPQMQYIYAESLVKTGEISSGKERLEELESAHPEIAEVHRGLGELLGLQGNMHKATEELKNAILLNANDPESHYDLGKIELEMGDTTAAIHELESATRLLPGDPRFHRQLADAYKAALRVADAEKELHICETLGDSDAQPAKTGPKSHEATVTNR